MQLHAIIPAGGAGTRLWPISSPTNPKFLLKVGNSTNSMLQNTIMRLVPIAESINIVTGQKHTNALSVQIQDLKNRAKNLPEIQIMTEPSPRDSMAAISLAAGVIARKQPEAIIGSFAADHVIKNPQIFHSYIQEAMLGAQKNYLVTCGIAPCEPATGYGYIKSGEPLEQIEGSSILKVQSFREKPDEQLAKQYLEDGNYWWNAGIFVVKAQVLLGALEDLHPEFWQCLQQIVKAWGKKYQEDVLKEYWPQLEKMPIDTALAEPMSEQSQVVMVPTEPKLGWSDVGDYRAMKNLDRDIEQENLENETRIDPSELLSNWNPEVNVETLESPGCIVDTPGLKGVCVLGIPEAVVVLREGKLLVTTLENSQKVKYAAEASKKWH